MKQVEGAYSLVSLSPQGLIAMRDPHGVRPLVLDRLVMLMLLLLKHGLDIIGADFIRDIKPGEMIIINDKGVASSQPLALSHRVSVYSNMSILPVLIV